MLCISQEDLPNIQKFGLPVSDASLRLLSTGSLKGGASHELQVERSEDEEGDAVPP